MKRVYRFLCMAIVAVCMLGVAAVVAACADKSTPSQPKEYTITLKLNEEQVWDSFTGKKGVKVEFEKGDPSRPNNNFKGWSLTPNGEVVELPTVMPENGGTYYAVFSRYYNITLRAGSGTLDGETRIRAEVGQNIYSLVKDILPTAPGKSTFDGWYYGNKKIDAESTDVMPTAAITLDAKYTVPYTINIFKQKDDKSDDYDKVTDDTVEGVGFIGSSPRDSLYPVYTGYEFFEEKSGATADFVLDAAGDNVFNAYYNIQVYRLVFNPNTPKNETVNGSMGTAEWGYDIENRLPDCEYTINGYRFVYWSTKEDGSDRLDVGKEYKITDNTTLYAIWLRGCADISGRSSDFIYLIDDGKGNTVACLERRYYLDDIIGTYNPATKVAVFKDENNTEILRGKLDPDSYSFAYLSSQAYVRHNLGDSQTSFGDGTIDETETLTLTEDGAATYVKGASNVNGTYEFDSDEQSIKFIPNGNDGESFYFRLTQFRSADGELTDVFEVRSEAEVGEWCRLTDDYVLGSDYADTNFVIEFNGYGEAVMHATSRVQETTVDYGGYYRYSATSTAEKPEIYILFITSYGNESNRITLVDRTKTADADAEYKRFYKECVVATTAYAKPDGDAALDIATADSITLDGYGLYADSAVYKVGEQTTSGSYVLNWSNRTLEFKPANNGNSVTYFVDTVTVGESDEAKTYLVYESIQSDKSELNKLWAISGLENNFKPGYAYGFRFFNDNEAVLYIAMPDINQTFNVLNVSLQPVFSGRYEPTEESGEYLFTADISAEAINLIAYYYSQIFKQAINISNFDDFKFKFTSSTAGEVTAIGDGINGVELVDDGATYVTDGYGKAKVTNSSGIVTATRDYVYSAAGLPCVTLKWEEDGTDVGGKPIKVSKSKLYTLIDGEYRENLKSYGKYNTQYSNQIRDAYFVLITYADDYAVLAYQSNGTLIMYSWGGITWTDSGKKFGTYAEHGVVAGADRTYYDLYGDFNFGFKDQKLSNGDIATRFFIYDTPASEVVDGKYVVNGKDGATLTVDLNKCEAEYSVPAADGGKTTIIGEFKLREDVLTIVYTQDAEDDKKTLHTVAFKLTYDVHGNVTAFDTVGIETGTWLDDTDINGSLELTGNPVDGGYAGVWHAYDRETDGLIDINGTYARTENTEVAEYIFNYTVEVDPENAEKDDGKRSFTFVIGYDTDNFVPVYRIYTIPVRVALYASITSQQPYYLLQGGGYADLVLVDPYNRQAVGQLLMYPNANIMTGTPLYAFGSTGRDPQPQLFFTIMGEGENMRGILLDGTFASTNFGAFECDDTRELTVPVLKDDESGEYENQTAVIDRIYFNGLGIAMLHRASDNTMLPAFYTRFNSTTYQLFQIVDGKPIAIAMFRLYKSTTEVPPEEEGGEPTTQTRYLVRFDDDGLRKIFNGVGSSVFITDGFGMATYVDARGGLHACTVSRLADHPEVVEVMYLDGMSLVRMYIEIKVEVKEDNTEECTFKILDSTDSRLPVPDSGEEGDNEGTQG